MKSVCPLHCPASGTDADADRVDWAGLPVILDLAFSQNQLDKVYTQYLMRRRRTPLNRGSRDIAQLCACDMADY